MNKNFLRTHGDKITDHSGNNVLLQGVGLANWLLPEGYMWKFGNKGDRPRRIESLFEKLIGPDKARIFWTRFRENFITESDISKIAELGFNSVRPAINARLLQTDDDCPQYLENGFSHIDNLVDWCEQYGIYVILDLHAAPGGQTGRNIDDSLNDVPELFIHEKYKERTVALWMEIARRYKDEPAVIAYDLLNEPLPRDQWHHLYPELAPFYKRLIAAIRTVDRNHMICCEGANWASDWSVFSEPLGENVFYQFHKYWNNNDTGTIKAFLDWRAQWDVPLWCGETGENTNEWLRGNMEILESNNIGWAFWPWKKINTQNTPYSIKEPAGWDKLSAYTNDSGPAPDVKESINILDEYLENIKLENCVFFQDVVDALFRK